MFKESRKLMLGYVHTAGVTIVHQFCHLGSFSFLSGGSVVSQDVQKYTMVAGERVELRGLNLVGLTRRGFSTAEIRNLKAAYRKIFMRADANVGSFEDRLAEVFGIREQRPTFANISPSSSYSHKELLISHYV
ncbi:hypothetical protein HN51_054469 [Arachis hypogaea]